MADVFVRSASYAHMDLRVLAHGFLNQGQPAVPRIDDVLISPRPPGSPTLLGFRDLAVAGFKTAEFTPPALTLIRDRLPTLTTRNTIRGSVLAPPDRLLVAFQKAVFARNELVHRGAEPLSRDSLVEKMTVIRDILLLLDYYQGQAWAYEQMTAATVAELGAREAQEPGA